MPERELPAPDSARTEPTEGKPARAVVHAGSVATNYQRLGSGAPVVLLGSPVEPWAGGPLLAVLARRFRVIVPEKVAGAGSKPRAASSLAAEPAFASWLADFLDGLGLMRVLIVAAGPFAIPALDFCHADPERVERLVLLLRDGPDTAHAERVIEDRLRRSGRPALVVRPGRGAEAAALTPEPALVDRVIGFLSGGATTVGWPDGGASATA